MEINQLIAFYQLSLDKNYGVAAKHLFITQSALTKKIKRLEESINVVLFERGRNGAILNQAGELLLPEAKRLIKQHDNLRCFASNIAQGTRGRLNIGFGISSYFEAPQYISEFKKRYPNINITLNDIPSNKQIDALLSGELQLSFNRLNHIQSPLQSLPLQSDQLAIAIHKSHKITTHNLWDSLSSLDYLRLKPDRGIGLHSQIEGYLNSVNQSPIATQESNDLLTLLALVSADLGYTIIPLSAHSICQKNVRLIKLNSSEACWETGLIWNNQNTTALIEKFITLVSKQSN